MLPGGETRVFHNVVAPIRDEAVALGILGINLDITERKKNESALLRAKDQAEAANRAKSSFLANMSHEIRTPLNGLLGMLQLIRFGNLSAEQQQYVEMAERSGRRLTGLLGDILDLSRIESGRMPIQAAPFALVDVCTALAETFSPLRLEKNLAFSLKIDEAIPQVLVGDELRVRQVLFNLIGNAMKFTDRGEVRGEVSLIAPPPNGGVRLLFIISDTGIGIPDDKLDQICSPFTQVDQDYTRAHQGAGLGLAIARQLVLAMGGTLTFESTANQGTSVYLMLPLGVPDHALRPVKPSQGWRERPSAAMRILLVEDEEISRLSARLILERLGHAVVTANDGKEALEALRKSVYDCVLMDVQMDVMGGVETTKNIRSGVSGVLDAQVPIIALTAYAMTGDREKFIGVGMNDYVTKPVQLEDLKNALWRVAEEQGKGSTP